MRYDIFMSLAFPQIDPVAISVGPLQIRWYALAYIGGILLGWWVIRRLAAKYEQSFHISKEHIDDFVTWAIVGVILGGRIGYMLFYNFSFYVENPSKILHVWEGGMSFHGGFVGVSLAIVLFALKHKIQVLRLADLIACVAPIGLFFGRITNFINGELYGRITDKPWGVVFPHAGPEPRHPSQLYEAGLEGLVLFCILMLCIRASFIRARAGLLTGIFILGYALSRTFVELFRQPDAHIGFVFANVTMGQILSSGMIVGALIILIYALRHKKVEEGQ